MSPKRRWSRQALSATALSVVALIVAPAFAPAAVSVLSTESKPTGLAGDGGHLIWSRWDATTRRYRLVEWHGGGRGDLLPIASSRAPFDADVGTTRDGRPELVFARCRDGSLETSSQLGALAPGLQHGCGIRRVVLTDPSHERAIDTRRPHGASDVLPRLDRGRLAFFRMPPRAGLGSVLASHARLMTLHAPGRLSSRAAGPVGVRNQDCHCDYASTTDGPLGLSARDGATVYSWDAHQRRSRRCTAAEPDPLAILVRRARTTAADATLAAACEGGRTFQLSGALTLGGGAVWWAWRDGRTSAPFVARMELSTGAIADAPLPVTPNHQTLALAWDGTALAFVAATDTGFVVARAAPSDLMFTPRAPLPNGG